MRTLLLALGLAALVTRPAPACCQLGGTSCGDPFAVDCNDGVVCFPPWRTCASCTCTVTNGGRTCIPNPAEPGVVSTLLMTKAATPGDLALSWTASCNAATQQYAVDEGAIGTWYSHGMRQCTASGALTATLTPFGGDRYYLIGAVSGDFTGSLGVSSAGAERAEASPSCTDDRALAPCP